MPLPITSLVETLVDHRCYLFSLFDGFDDFDQWVLMVLISGFNDFDQWVLMILISGFGILMSGLMMEASLMMVVEWIDDGGWVDDHCCYLFSLFDR